MKMSTGFTESAINLFNMRGKYTTSYGVSYIWHPGCCTVIWNTFAGPGDRTTIGFKEVFGENKNQHEYWFGKTNSLNCSKKEERKNFNHRIFALLLMAELAKDIGE